MKRKITALTLCVALIVSVLSFSFVMAAEESEVFINESFNQYATNDVPVDLQITSNSHFIKEYASNEKGLFVSDQPLPPLKY